MAKRQRRDLSVFESSCHLPTCLPHTMGASHCLFNCWTSSREAVNTNFYSLWFDSTGNRTRVYRFSSRRSIHSTTDRSKLATGVSFFVLVASAVATVGPGAPSPPNDCLCLPILVHSKCFFGASRHDKTTANNGKRNNNFQTWFSFEVFSIVCKIAGHQLLFINVTQ